jgi:PTS system nitrogen regulatory IIA component
MTDLPDLLAEDRIRCGCEIRSKKRALQTIAELLGASLRDDPAETGAEDDSDALPHTGPGTDANTDTSARDVARDADSADATQEPTISDMDILDALITRERLGSTGIGHGFALPHSRLAGIEEPLAALVTLTDGVDFEAIDDVAVDVVVGLLVPKECNDEHLQILATLARRFKDAEQRDAIRSCTDAKALMSYLTSTSPSA